MRQQGNVMFIIILNVRICKHVIQQLLIFRQARVHVEQEGMRVRSKQQELQKSGCNSFELKCIELLRQIDSIRQSI